MNQQKILSTGNWGSNKGRQFAEPQTCKQEITGQAGGRLGWENWDCLALRTDSSGVISLLCTNTWWEAVKMTVPDSFQWHPVKGQGAMGPNWNTRNFNGTHKKLSYSESGQGLEQVARRGCEVSIFGDIQNPTGQCREQPALFDLALSGGVWARWSPELPSNLNYSTTLLFSEYYFWVLRIPSSPDFCSLPITLHAILVRTYMF